MRGKGRDLIAWRFERFANLTPAELHDVFRARIEVFVVEQQCAFQDLDGADPAGWHLIGRTRPSPQPPPKGGGEHHRGSPSPRGPLWGSEPMPEGPGEGELVAYCRILPPGTKYPEPTIGRVLTTAAVRGTGAGRVLMREALARAQALWPGRAVRIGAQQRLERFYREMGFVPCSEPYDEDGIPHIEMRLERGEP